jgi:hypothetical protein
LTRIEVAAVTRALAVPFFLLLHAGKLELMPAWESAMYQDYLRAASRRPMEAVNLLAIPEPDSSSAQGRRVSQFLGDGDEPANTPGIYLVAWVIIHMGSGVGMRAHAPGSLRTLIRDALPIVPTCLEHCGPGASHTFVCTIALGHPYISTKDAIRIASRLSPGQTLTPLAHESSEWHLHQLQHR